MLDRIEVGKAARGWRNALAMRENNQVQGAKVQARQVAALLIQHPISREDEVGDLARQLRREFPKASLPLAKTIEPIELPDDVA